MTTPTDLRIGVDLGGTKIEAIALDAAGSVRSRRRVATPADDYAAILRAIADLVAGLEQDLGQTGTVGIAMPGAISKRTERIKNANTVVLNGRPLSADLSEVLARPVRLENDANCFALSEAVDGAAASAKMVFGVILGTGVGGGLVIDRRIIAGRNGVAGEWGHNPLPWARADDQARPCYCGKVGCIETFLSGPGLALDYRFRQGKDLATKTLAAQEIVLAAEAGDDIAADCLNVYQDRLARGLASVINLLDPDAIVLGGGLSNITQLYSSLPSIIDKYAFSDGIDTPILRAAHGDSSGVRGAAWLWPAPMP
jgi:fructokinase